MICWLSSCILLTVLAPSRDIAEWLLSSYSSPYFLWALLERFKFALRNRSSKRQKFFNFSIRVAVWGTQHRRLQMRRRGRGLAVGRPEGGISEMALVGRSAVFLHSFGVPLRRNFWMVVLPVLFMWSAQSRSPVLPWQEENHSHLGGQILCFLTEFIHGVKA